MNEKTFYHFNKLDETTISLVKDMNFDFLFKYLSSKESLNLQEKNILSVLYAVGLGTEQSYESACSIFKKDERDGFSIYELMELLNCKTKVNIPPSKLDKIINLLRNDINEEEYYDLSVEIILGLYETLVPEDGFKAIDEYGRAINYAIRDLFKFYNPISVFFYCFILALCFSNLTIFENETDLDERFRKTIEKTGLFIRQERFKEFSELPKTCLDLFKFFISLFNKLK